MLSLVTKISLIALWAIMAGFTLAKALPGELDLAAALESRANTPYIGVCFVSSGRLPPRFLASTLTPQAMPPLLLFVRTTRNATKAVRLLPTHPHNAHSFHP